MNDRVSEELLAAAAQQFVADVVLAAKARPTPQPLNFLDFISAENGCLTTDSLKVAAVHGKRHDNVLRLIRQRIKDAGAWGLLNFEETPYIDSQSGQSYPMYSMTKNGYMFLVGKMPGKLAAQHQIAYIEAFDAMAEYVRNQRDGLRYRCMELELESKDSKLRGSYHGKGLNTRKQEKMVIDPELDALKKLVQPRLV